MLRSILPLPASVVFMGTPQIAVPCLNALLQDRRVKITGVYSQPDRPVGRKRVMTSPPVAAFAKDHQLPLFQPERVKSEEELEILRELKPDIMIVCAYGQILPQELLDIPTVGCFNIHFSKLPRWRGASPVQAAVLHGDPDIIVSLQKMVLKLDAGPIVSESAPEPILEEDTAESLEERLSHVAASHCIETLGSLISQTFSLTPQDESQATYCRIIKKSEGHVAWNEKSAIEVERQLRAYSPWPGIYSLTHEGKRVQWLKLKVLPNVVSEPGLMNGDLVIGCRQGSVQVLELKPEGKQAMSAEAFIRGYAHLLNTPLS